MSYAQMKAASRELSTSFASRAQHAVRRKAFVGVADNLGSSGIGGLAREAQSREAYSQFKLWVHASINVIARKVAGQSIMAGEQVGAEENPERAARMAMKEYAQRQSLHCGKIKRQRDYLPASLRQAVDFGNLEVLEQHPVLDHLARPNPVQRRAEFLYFSVANLLITGECYWVGGEVGDGEFEVWAIPTPWVTPKHKGGVFTGYDIQLGSHIERDVDPESVARTFIPDPADPKGAFSPLRAILSPVRVDAALVQSQEDMFERGINPNLIVTVGQSRGPDGKPTGRRPKLQGHQRRSFIRAIRAIWNEAVSAGEPAIVDGLIESVHKLHNTPREMDWMDSGKVVKDRVLQAYGVNPINLGQIDGANRAQAVEAEKSLCFPRGTLVMCPNGVRAIEDVRVGDEVWTHQGRRRKVTDLFRRSYHGKMIAVRASGCSKVLATEQHPFWVSRNGKCQWVKAGDLQLGDCLAFPRIGSEVIAGRPTPKVSVSSILSVRRVPERKQEMLQDDECLTELMQNHGSNREIAGYLGCDISHIQKKRKELGIVAAEGGIATCLPRARRSRVVLSAGKQRHGIKPIISVTASVSEVLGMFAAEGCFNSRRRMTWNFGHAESEYVSKVRDVLYETFGVTSSVHEGDGTLILSASNVTLVSLFRKWFLGPDGKKTVPNMVYEWPKKQRLAFIMGYLRGDGCFATKRDAINGQYAPVSNRRIQFSSTSSSLAYGIRAILSGIGHGCTIQRYEQLKSSSMIQGRKCKIAKHKWVGGISGQTHRMMTGVHKHRSLACTSWRSAGKYVLHRIVSLSSHEAECEVFNFEVADDNSYVLADGGAVHNCNNAVNPIARALSDTMTDFYGPKLSDPPRLIVWIEPCEPKDPELDLRRWSEARKNDDVSREEYRANVLGIGPDERESRGRLLTLVGGLTGAGQIATQVGQGLLSREAAIAMYQVFFEIDEATAESMVGEGQVVNPAAEPPKPEEIEEAIERAVSGQLSVISTALAGAMNGTRDAMLHAMSEIQGKVPAVTEDAAKGCEADSQLLENLTEAQELADVT